MKFKIKSIAQNLFPGYEKQLEELLPYLDIKRFKSGELLVGEGQKLDYVGFIFKGVIRKYYRNQSKDGQTIYFSFEGSIVAELNSLLHNRPAVYCIQAVEDTNLVTINAASVPEVSSRFPFLQNLSFQQLERAYTRELENIVFSNTNTAESRYREMLRQQPDIIIRVPGHYIASYLGIRPESLSRIRRSIAG